MWPLWPVLGQPFPVLQSLGPPLSQARLQPADTARPGADAAPSPREGGKQLGGRGGEAAADLLRVNPSSVSLLTSSFGSSTGRECCQDPSPGHPSQPAPHPTLEKPEARIWGGRPASLPRGGVWLSPARASWPRVRPSAPLGRQPPPGCLFQVGSRGGPPEAPSAPGPPSSPAQKQPHAPPQPTAHKSLSPRDLACPFHVPAAGDLPFHRGRQLLVSRPLKHGCGPACRPPLQGGRGGTSRGKGQLCHLPRVLNGASARP